MSGQTPILRRAAGPVGLAFAAFVIGEAAGLAGSSHARIPMAVMANAAILGCLSAMFAAGIVLVYRASRVINFSMAAFGVGAGMLFMLLTVMLNWSFWLAFPAAFLAATLVGLLMELLLVRRFTHSPRLVLTVVTIAVGQVLAGAIGLLPRAFGLRPEDPTPTEIAHSPVSRYAWKWFPLTFRGDHLVAIAATVLVMAGLAAFFRFSSLGIAIRGAAENEERASLLGINTGSLSTFVWTAAAAMSALAALLLLPLQATTIGSVGIGVGAGTLLRALAAAVIGRMENLPLTVAAAIGISVVEGSVFWAFSRSSIVDAALLAVVVVGLLVQRKKLARAEESLTGSWAATAEVRPIPLELRDTPAVRRGVRRGIVVAAIVLLAFPWVMSPSQTDLGSLYAIYGIIAISLVVLTGWGGQISLGQFAFVAIGAAVGGALTGRWGWPFLLAVPVASAVGAGVAVLVGLPALRIRGLFLAVTTMAFAVVASTVVLSTRYFGWLLPTTINRPKLLFIDTNDNRSYYYLCLVALALTVLAAQGLRRTRTGRVLIAMRDNERAAQAFGVNLVRTRLATFAISGALAAFAGVLYAHHQTRVDPRLFAPEQSIQMFLMAVIGGLGSVSGVLLGALYLGTVNIVVAGTSGRLLASAAGVLIVLLFYPGGLGSAVFAVRDAWLRRIALRDRIFVPSLVGDYSLLDGEAARIPLAPRADADREDEPVPVRYRRPSRIGVAGASQAGAGWRFG